jgi:hypothetical protein
VGLVIDNLLSNKTKDLNNEEDAMTKFLNTYDKEYLMFNDKIDRLRKSTS